MRIMQAYNPAPTYVCFNTISTNMPKPKRKNNPLQLKKEERVSKKKQKHNSKQESKFEGISQARSSSVIDKQAADILSKLLGGKPASLKTLVYRDSVQEKKATYAVITKALGRLDILKILSEAVPCESVKQEDYLILIYEILFGEGLKRHGKAEKKVLEVESQLRTELQKIADEKGVAVDELGKESLSDSTFRYARINTIKSSISQIQNWMNDQGYEEVKVHDLFEDVIVLDGSIEWYKNELVQSGEIVLQGLSSCMAAHAMSPKPGWKVLDCCAAPGNKTTHLAAFMGNQGVIYALDRDEKRLATLKQNVQSTGSSIITPLHRDFLSISTSEFGQVDALLLDPSCSGSGTMNNKIDQIIHKHTKNEERVRRLSDLQFKMLKHALKFEGVQKVVYSTCSVFEEENEQVVDRVMEEEEVDGWQLTVVLPEWKQRGKCGYKCSNYVIRVDPSNEGNVDGFFIACFEKH